VVRNCGKWKLVSVNVSCSENHPVFLGDLFRGGAVCVVNRRERTVFPLCVHFYGTSFFLKNHLVYVPQVLFSKRPWSFVPPPSPWHKPPSHSAHARKKIRPALINNLELPFMLKSPYKHF